MLKPLEQFYCDTCDMLIEKVDDGAVEWKDKSEAPEGRHLSGSFRICHNTKTKNCYQPERTGYNNNSALSKFLGEEGYIQLLDFIDRGSRIDKNYSGTRISDMREYVEFVKRLTIPHYEEARHYWDEAQQDGFFDNIGEHKYFLKETLTELIEKYSSEEEE
ncbi:MAG TPA: hypothetical protein VFI33_04320 [Puia sp.]|nr:hypothetical protein [Puia sp.]